MSPAPKRLGILLSGRGSNFLAIADAIDSGTLQACEIAVVLSNRSDAPGLLAAQQRGLTALAIPSKGVPRPDHDEKIIAALQQHEIDYVILAGYMRLLSPGLIHAFPDRILNIHPSLLPAFPGLHPQQQALDAGVKLSGCTVHFVEEKVDSGVIILQRHVPVEDDDTAEILSARILEQEHIAYAEAIGRVLSQQYRMDGRRYVKQQP